MYRTVNDFAEDWKQESEATLKLFRNISDESLNQRVYADGRELGRLAWHVVQSAKGMAERAGLTIDAPALSADIPTNTTEIVSSYEQVAQGLSKAVTEQWKDTDLDTEVEMYGRMWKKGKALMSIINHQAHHRGQITVLMRQANLKVTGVYGPAKEEWAVWGMPTMP